MTTDATPSIASKIWNHPYTFWALLSIPALPMLNSLYNGSLRGVLHPSGEFSARFMIIVMMITPLMMMFPRARIIRWFNARRRYLGVAAFGYAALHTLAYVMREGTLAKILGEFWELGIWTGWLAFLIFIPLAITSNDWFIRQLGQNWKSLQRWVYAAAVATLAHWIFLKYEFGGAMVHFTPLILLEAYRIGRNLKLIPKPAN